MISKYKKLLYLLQLENYNLFRFFGALQHKKLFLRRKFRKSLVITNKLKIIILLIVLINILMLLGMYMISLTVGPIFLVIAYSAILIWNVFYQESFIFLATAIFFPFDYLVKKCIYWRASRKMKTLSNIIVIGVVGSYGKSTVKHFLTEVLKNKLNIISTVDNINTPIGISRQILKDLNNKHEIFIVEMGEYYRGDILEICRIVNPKIGIVTGINEAHLERLRHIDNTIDTIFEISKFAGILYVNEDDCNVLKGIDKYSKNIKKKYFYSSKTGKVKDNNPLPILEFDEKLLRNRISIPVISTDYKFTQWVKFETKILAPYVVGLSVLALEIGSKIFKLDIDYIISQIRDIEPVPHRLQVIKSEEKGVIVIDDSYNGNPSGFKIAVDLLSQFKQRRKILLTPGIVEIGEQSKQIHLELGEYIAKANIDKVILVMTKGGSWIYEGLQNSNYNKANVVCYETSEEAFQSLSTQLALNDVILFQNDITDNYF